MVPDVRQRGDEIKATKLKSDATLFARATSVVRDRSDIFDRLDVHSCCLDRGDRTFATTARTIDANINIANAKLDRFFGSLLRGGRFKRSDNGEFAMTVDALSQYEGRRSA